MWVGERFLESLQQVMDDAWNEKIPILCTGNTKRVIAACSALLNVCYLVAGIYIFEMHSGISPYIKADKKTEREKTNLNTPLPWKHTTQWLNMVSYSFLSHKSQLCTSWTYRVRSYSRLSPVTVHSLDQIFSCCKSVQHPEINLHQLGIWPLNFSGRRSGTKSPWVLIPTSSSVLSFSNAQTMLTPHLWNKLVPWWIVSEHHLMLSAADLLASAFEADWIGMVSVLVCLFLVWVTFHLKRNRVGRAFPLGFEELMGLGIYLVHVEISHCGPQPLLKCSLHLLWWRAR